MCPRCLRKIILSFIAFTASFGFVSAQDFEEEFNAFKRNQSKGFENYRDEIDANFSEFVANSWDEFLNKEKVKPEPKPKPKVLPPAPKPVIQEIEEEKEVDNLDDDLGSLDDLVASSPVNHKQFKMPTKESSKDFEVTYTAQQISLWGQTMKFRFDKKIFELPVTGTDESSVAEAWKYLGNTDYSASLFDLFRTKSSLQVNDYALYSMINAGLKGSSLNINQQRVVSWFLFLKMGYNVKLASDSKGLFLLIPTLQDVYNTRFVEIDGINYYIFDEDRDPNLKTYRNTYALAQRHFDLGQALPLQFSEVKPETREIAFEFSGRSYELALQYDPNAINYYQELPQVDYTHYLFAKGSNTFQSSIEDAIGPIVANMSDQQKVEFLLSMVQNGFPYQTDDDQFGEEQFFFPEEILFHSHSDCEDRSAFLIYLVKQFSGLDAVALDYPQHIAVAVSLDETIPGRFYTAQGTRYYVADPTYIGAPIGQSLVSETPKVLFDPNIEQNNINQAAIQRIQTSGNRILYQASEGIHSYLYVNLTNGNYAFLKISEGKLAYASQVVVSPYDQNTTAHLLTFDRSGSLIAHDAFDEVGYDSFGIYVNRNGSFVTLPSDKVSIQ